MPRPPCVFGADGELRCGTASVWGPRVVDADRTAALVEAETQQAVQYRQWLWQQQNAVVDKQEQREQKKNIATPK